jgi:ubiquinone/menaquinone biosynthesis C-methylase UbiE
MTTDDRKSYEISPGAAEVYERYFVPILCYPWALKLVNAAAICRGERVLDVACGTGVLSRESALRGAKVTGLDSSAAMLEVASRLAPDVAWHCGMAERLPFDVGEFDVALNQFGLMYVADVDSAIREMVRVLRPGGRLAVALLDADQSPGFWALIALVRRLFGDEPADALPAPYILGTPAQIEKRFVNCGASKVNVESCSGSAVFSSLREWLFTEIRGWTLSEVIDNRQFETLVKEAAIELALFVAPDGRVIFDSPVDIVTATKPAALPTM